MEPTAKTVFLRRERAASVGKRKQERSIPRQRNGSPFVSFTPQRVEMRRRRADGVTSKRRPQLPVSVKVFERLRAIHPELLIHDSLHLFNINSQRNSPFTFVSFKRRKKKTLNKNARPTVSEIFPCTRPTPSQVCSRRDCCETEPFRRKGKSNTATTCLTETKAHIPCPASNCRPRSKRQHTLGMLTTHRLSMSCR